MKIHLSFNKIWLLLGAFGVLQVLLNMEYTAVNLALMPIAEEINVKLSTLQWLLSAYLLVWGSFLIPAGRLADLYGKRNILIGGLLLFIGGSYCRPPS